MATFSVHRLRLHAVFTHEQHHKCGSNKLAVSPANLSKQFTLALPYEELNRAYRAATLLSRLAYEPWRHHMLQGRAKNHTTHLGKHIRFILFDQKYECR